MSRGPFDTGQVDGRSRPTSDAASDSVHACPLSRAGGTVRTGRRGRNAGACSQTYDCRVHAGTRGVGR
jgi:hypothetical protein